MSNTIADVVSDLLFGVGYFIFQSCSPVQHANHILEIVAHDVIVVSSSVKSLQLGRNKVNRID